MAIIACKECGGKVSDAAAACPHCGAPVVTKAPPDITTEKKKGGLRWWHWVIGLPIAFIGILFVIGANMDPMIDYEYSIKQMLKDPNSAQFSDVRRYKNGAACGMVNAKNGFGAYIGPRGFVVAPSRIPIMDDGTNVGSKMYARMRDEHCSGPLR